MATINFKGNAIHTTGNLPVVGSTAPDFKLTKVDLSTTQLSDYKGQRLVLNIFPSLDTGTCAASVRQFNKLASSLENTTVLCVSKDLPFAHKRFCTTEGLENVYGASQYRDHGFTDNYPVEILEGPLTGLMSRAVVVINEEGNVVYTEQVNEVSEEPNYENAIASLK
jgi:thioredoxin-dependent peroxiredoxin